jgi:hypothetical protein
MRTRESHLFGGILGNALNVVTPEEVEQIDREIATEWDEDISKVIGAAGEPVDPMRREAALRAWEKRDRGAGEDLRRKAEAHRAAGEDRDARIAERKAAIADVRHQRRIQAIQDHRKQHGIPQARFTPGFPVAPKKDPAPGQRRHRDDVREEDPGNKAERELAEQQAREDAEARHVVPSEKPQAKLPDQPKPVERKHEGNWEKVKGKHREERQKLHDAGFERVDVSPLTENQAGKHVAHEVLEHPDGRKVEHHIEYNPDSDSGHLRVVEHAAPPQAAAGPMERPVNHKQKAVVGGHDAMKKANADRKHIEEVGHLGGGIRESYKVHFKDGQQAIYKPGFDRDGKPVTPVGVRRSLGNIREAPREVAAYKISNAAGFDIVPPVEIVKYPDPNGKVREGHAMGFIDGQIAGKLRHGQLSKDGRDGHPDLHRIAALDMVIGSTDRHPGNFMKGNDGRYYAIDSGLTIPLGEHANRWAEMHDNPSTPLQLVRGQKIPDEVKAEIKRITPEHIKSSLKEAGFDDKTIKFALARLEVVQGLKTWPREGELRKQMAERYAGAR